MVHVFELCSEHGEEVHFVALEKICIWKGLEHWHKHSCSVLQGDAFHHRAAQSGYRHILPGKGAFKKRERVCVWYEFRRKALKACSFKQVNTVFTNTKGSWTSFSRFGLPSFLERKHLWKLDQQLLLLLHCMCCGPNEWSRACSEIQLVRVGSIQKTVLM